MAGTSRQLRLEAKVRDQLDGIKAAYAEKEINIDYRTENGGLSFMYVVDQILVRDEYLERVQGILGQVSGGGNATRVIAGIVLLTLEVAIDTPDIRVQAGVIPAVPDAVDAVDEVLGVGIATPNQILTVCGVVSPCPATEPRTVEDGIEPHPGVCTDNSGAGVLVYIADTGLLEGADTDHYWLRGVERAREKDGALQAWDWDPPTGPDDDDADRLIETPLRTAVHGRKFIRTPYIGHGTFVAGVVRCLAPRAEVIVSRVCSTAGSVSEAELVKDLERALKLGVDIFHLSVAGPSKNGVALQAFERWHVRMRAQGGVCVVTAGNSGVRTPTWPAAFAQSVAVGALTADGRDRAEFSNYGGWVDVYAPGRDLINAYATGTYTYQDAPYTGDKAKFYGMAKWSGTSFSTPIVSGLIAARMSRTGENGQEAADALLRLARSQAIPDVGAILLPCDGKGNC